MHVVKIGLTWKCNRYAYKIKQCGPKLLLLCRRFELNKINEFFFAEQLQCDINSSDSRIAQIAIMHFRYLKARLLIHIKFAIQVETT